MKNEVLQFNSLYKYVYSLALHAKKNRTNSTMSGEEQH